MVEMAIVLPLLLTVLLGMIDFGKAIHYWIDETHLAHEGARWAAVNRNPGAPGRTLQAYIRDQVTTGELRNGGTGTVPAGAQVCISFPGASGALVGEPVQVEIRTRYTFPLVRRIGIPAITIVGRSTMRLEATPTEFSAGCSA